MTGNVIISPITVVLSFVVPVLDFRIKDTVFGVNEILVRLPMYNVHMIAD